MKYEKLPKPFFKKIKARGKYIDCEEFEFSSSEKASMVCDMWYVVIRWDDSVKRQIIKNAL